MANEHVSLYFTQEATSWAWATVLLAPGPALGVILIATLKSSADAAKIGNGKG